MVVLTVVGLYFVWHGVGAVLTVPDTGDEESSLTCEIQAPGEKEPTSYRGDDCERLLREQGVDPSLMGAGTN